MLLVKTTLRQSIVHGLGVFAAEFIPAGTVVWYFQPDFDFRVSEESVAALPEIARGKILHYSAKWGGGYVISADDARFINHSSGAANLRTLEDPDVDIATRDIQAGEELLEDYREFDDTFGCRPIERGIVATAKKEVCRSCGHTPHIGRRCGAELPEGTYLGSHCACAMLPESRPDFQPAEATEAEGLTTRKDDLEHGSIAWWIDRVDTVVSELPQMDAEPLLQKAIAIAQLRQAEALERIARVLERGAGERTLGERCRAL